MNIQYNIADKKILDRRRFFLLVGLLVVLSGVLVLLGVKTLHATGKRFQDEKDRLKEYKEKIQSIVRQEDFIHTDIKNIKAKWRRELSFSGRLIDGKLFPYIHQLDRLEGVLPGGAYVTRVRMGTETGDRVQLNLAAVSSSKLLEAYKVFLKHNLVIQKEAHEDGVFKASVTVTLK